MLRKLYIKTIELAGNKNSKFFLGAISFIESFVFPIPPDVVIIPMTIAKPNKVVSYSFNSNYWVCFRCYSRIFYWIYFF